MEKNPELNKKGEMGKRGLVWLPNHLFNMSEKARKNLGMSKSAFYRYAIIQLLQQLGVFSTKAKEDLFDQAESSPKGENKFKHLEGKPK